MKNPLPCKFEREFELGKLYSVFKSDSKGLRVPFWHGVEIRPQELLRTPFAFLYLGEHMHTQGHYSCKIKVLIEDVVGYIAISEEKVELAE